MPSIDKMTKKNLYYLWSRKISERWQVESKISKSVYISGHYIKQLWHAK